MPGSGDTKRSGQPSGYFLSISHCLTTHVSVDFLALPPTSLHHSLNHQMSTGNFYEMLKMCHFGRMYSPSPTHPLLQARACLCLLVCMVCASGREDRMGSWGARAGPAPSSLPALGAARVWLGLQSDSHGAAPPSSVEPASRAYQWRAGAGSDWLTEPTDGANLFLAPEIGGDTTLAAQTLSSTEIGKRYESDTHSPPKSM